MADAPSRPVPPPDGSGIKFHDGSPWNGQYIGSREALTSTDIVPQGAFFPGDRPGRQQCRFVTPGGRKASISKRMSQYCVTLYGTKAEDEAWRASQKEQAVAARNAARAAEARRELQDMLDSADDWRKEQARCIAAVAGAALGWTSASEYHGFYFQRADIDSIQESIKRLREQILNTPVSFSQERHEARRRELMAVCAADDSALQDFLARAQAQAGQTS